VNKKIFSKLLKKISTAFFAVFILFLSFPVTVSAQTDTSQEGFNSTYTVKSFNSDVNVNKKGIYVQETITVNFTQSSRGIKRFLPLIYEYHSGNGEINNVSRLDINVISIKDEGGNDIKYTTSVQRDAIYNNKDLLLGLFYDTLNIKIGDPAVFLTGDKTYILKYEVKNLPESPNPLLYTLTPTGSSTALNNYSANITFETKPTSFACIYGEARTDGSESCKVKKISDTNYQIQSQNIEFKSGLSIKVDGLAFEHNTPDIIQFVKLYWYLIVPLLLLSCLFIYWIIQRAPKGTGVIVPQFTIPEDLKPAEVGTIYDDSVDKVDVSATIIDLAVNGFLKIKNNGTDNKPDFELILQKPLTDPTLRNYEYTLLSGMFYLNTATLYNQNNVQAFTPISIKLKDLQKQSLATSYETVKNQIYLKGVLLGFYKNTPDKVNTISYAIVFAVITAVPAIIFNLLSIPVAIIIGLVTLFVAFPMFYFRNFKSEKGILMKEKIMGLKLFIEYAKKDQLEMLQTPLSKQEIFEKYLPYAMVFGLHKSWAEAFKGINLTTPDWYEGNVMGNMFDTLFFLSYINFFSNTLYNSFSIPISDSGAGFIGGAIGDVVGGGFSGGGLDSW